jgi:hypothetical protein
MYGGAVLCLFNAAIQDVHRWLCSSLKAKPFLPASTAAIDFFLQQP